MRKFCSLFLILAMAAPAWAQDAVPLVPQGGDFIIKDVDVLVITKEKRLLFRSLPFTLCAPTDDNIAGYKWIVPPGITATDRDDKLEVTAAPKGEAVVEIKVKYGVVVDNKIRYTTKTGSLKFLVGEVAPIPPVPPMPPPDPPKPVPPPPSPVPIPALGLRVLMIYGTDEAGQPILSVKQQNEIYGEELNKYLNAKCAKGADGKTAEFRIWKKDTPLANASKVWQDAMALPRGNEPWLIVSDGVTGFSIPLPDGGILAKIKEVGK